MKGFINSGDLLTMAAPSNVTKDVPILIGTWFCIPTETVASGTLTSFVRRGKVRVPKGSGQAWSTIGAKVYWDDTNKNVTTTASGNSLIGGVAEAAASADTVGYVILNGITI